MFDRVSIPTPFATFNRQSQWLLMLAFSILFSGLLQLLGLPAALFLGPMIGGVLIQAGGGGIKVPRLAYHGAQAVIGCMIAGTVNAGIIPTFAKDWPLFLTVVALIIGACAGMGWLVGRWRIFPGTTGVWGLSPGAASAMMLMAEAYGADARLVAFMQYLRVVLVTSIASVVARLWIDHAAPMAPKTVPWFPHLEWLPFLETLAIVIVGAVIGKRVRIPAGIMLGPMILGGILHIGGSVVIDLPRWLLVISYAFLGWRIGLGFTRPILLHALKALPQTLFSILAIIAFCGCLAAVLVRAAGIDPLTAYLATSPGGMDSIAIIAASSNADMPFIMTLQTIRFLAVLFVGPTISRYIARHL